MKRPLWTRAGCAACVIVLLNVAGAALAALFVWLFLTRYFLAQVFGFGSIGLSGIGVRSTPAALVVISVVGSVYMACAVAVAYFLNNYVLQHLFGSRGAWRWIKTLCLLPVFSILGVTGVCLYTVLTR